jgi:hypothetical protein
MAGSVAKSNYCIQKFKKCLNSAQHDSIYSNLLPSHLSNYIFRICHKALQAYFIKPALSSQTTTHT